MLRNIDFKTTSQKVAFMLYSYYHVIKVHVKITPDLNTIATQIQGFHGTSIMGHFSTLRVVIIVI